jgi:hypothetical protein
MCLPIDVRSSQRVSRKPRHYGNERGERRIVRWMGNPPLSAPLCPTMRILPADTRTPFPLLLVFRMIDLQAVYQWSISYLNNPRQYPIDDLQSEERRVEMFFGRVGRLRCEEESPDYSGYDIFTLDVGCVFAIYVGRGKRYEVVE